MRIIEIVEPRCLCLTFQMPSRESAVLDLWRDLLHEGEPFQLRLVRPNPPCGGLECSQAHIILEQGQAPDQVPFLISVTSRNPLRFGDRQITHSAHSATNLQNTPSLIRLPFPRMAFSEPIGGSGLLLQLTLKRS